MSALHISGWTIQILRGVILSMSEFNIINIIWTVSLQPAKVHWLSARYSTQDKVYTRDSWADLSRRKCILTLDTACGQWLPFSPLSLLQAGKLSVSLILAKDAN